MRELSMKGSERDREGFLFVCKLEQIVFLFFYNGYEHSSKIKIAHLGVYLSFVIFQFKVELCLEIPI
jgi:hypothetical protein